MTHGTRGAVAAGQGTAVTPGAVSAVTLQVSGLPGPEDVPQVWSSEAERPPSRKPGRASRTCIDSQHIYR
jgi:hypothetical protein